MRASKVARALCNETHEPLHARFLSGLRIIPQFSATLLCGRPLMRRDIAHESASAVLVSHIVFRTAACIGQCFARSSSKLHIVSQ